MTSKILKVSLVVLSAITLFQSPLLTSVAAAPQLYDDWYDPDGWFDGYDYDYYDYYDAGYYDDGFYDDDWYYDTYADDYDYYDYYDYGDYWNDYYYSDYGYGYGYGYPGIYDYGIY